MEFRYLVKEGETIRHIAEAMVITANSRGCLVTASFRGVELRAEPDWEADRIVQVFRAVIEERLIEKRRNTD